MNSRIKTSFLLIFCISFLACSTKTDEFVLPRDKMVSVLHDIQLGEAMYQTKYNQFNKREQKDALINYILKKHEITQTQLDSSLVWYSDNAELYMKVNDSVISSLKSDIKMIENSNSSNNLGENYNNLIIANHAFLSSNNPVITFSIDSLLIKNYQNFEITFDLFGLTAIDTTAEFFVTYIYPDTTVIDKKKLQENINYKSINTLPNDTLRSVTGYIYINPLSIQQRNILVNNIRVKDNKKDSQQQDN